MKRIELCYPSDPRTVHDVRRRFDEFVRGEQVDPDTVEDLKVAISEACANAICHGSPQGMSNTFSVTCCLGGDELVIEVEDQGRGFSPAAIASLPDGYSPSGRGMFIMQHLCDNFDVVRRPDGTLVRMVKHLGQPDYSSPDFDADDEEVEEAAHGGTGTYQASAQPSRRGSLPPMSTPLGAR